MSADLASIAPMLAPIAAALAIVGLSWTPRARLAPAVAGLGVAASAVLAFVLAGRVGPGRALEAFVRQATLPDGSAIEAALVRVDAFGAYALLALAAFGALAVLIGAGSDLGRPEVAADHHVLTLVALAAMMLLAVASDLILIFLAIETFSLVLYLLCGLRRGDRFAREAAFKYFLLGSFSAGFLLYGVALAYAGTGTTDLRHLGAAVEAGAGGVLPLAALALLLVGLGFKVAIVPFHQWTPDVYSGAPLPVTAFMAAGTKLAAFVALFRVVWTAFGAESGQWLPVLAALAVATIVVGNLAALVQADLRRMLGYSAVAHAGYLLVAVVAGSPEGSGAALFYLAVYGVTNLGAFAVLAAMGPVGAEGRDAARLDDLRGLWRRQPWLALAMGLFLVSLTGLPPTAGFLAKWYLFRAAVGADATWLAVVVVAGSVVSAFYYLRPVAYMAMSDDGETDPIEVGTPSAVAIATSATLVALALVAAGPFVDGALEAGELATGGPSSPVPIAQEALPPSR